MDKRDLSINIDCMVAVTHKKGLALKSLAEAVSLIADVYEINKEEAFNILAVQGIVFAYTADSKEDEPAREDIFMQAGNILSEWISRSLQSKEDERR